MADPTSSRFDRGLITFDCVHEFAAPADLRAKRNEKKALPLAGHERFCIEGLWRSAPAMGEALTI